MDPSREEPEKPAPMNIPKALDGGWGWVIVLGAFIAYFIADGWSYSFGIFFPVLIDHFGEGKGKTAIIGALLYGIPMVISPFVCALTTVYGCRPVAMAGGIFTGLSFICSAFATSIDLLCLSTGILASLGLCMTYIPSIVAVTMYFDKRRGLATGLAVTGSGLGAFAFPPLLEFLLGQYSWRGALLVVGGICFNIVAAGSLFRPLPVDKDEDVLTIEGEGDSGIHVRRRAGNILVPRLHKKSILRNRSQSLNLVQYEATAKPSTWSLNRAAAENETINIGDDNSKQYSAITNQFMSSSPDLYPANEVHEFKEEQSKIRTILNETKSVLVSTMDKSLLHNWNFLLFCGSSFILYMWIGIPYVYLVDKSMLLGITDQRAAFLLSTIGISRTVGQLVLGALGDWPKINTIGLYAGSVLMCGIATLLVPICMDYASLSVYAVLFGFSVSSTYALQMICIVHIVGLEKSTAAFGLLQLAMGISTLLGTPVSGKQLHTSSLDCFTRCDLVLLICFHLQNTRGRGLNTFYRLECSSLLCAPVQPQATGSVPVMSC